MSLMRNRQLARLIIEGLEGDCVLS